MICSFISFPQGPAPHSTTALMSRPAVAQDSTADQVSISAVAVDGADNAYAVAVNETTRFAGFLRIYSIPSGTDGGDAATTIGLSANLFNAASKLTLPTSGGAGTSGWSMPSSTLYDGPGAPGGYGAGAPLDMHT